MKQKRRKYSAEEEELYYLWSENEGNIVQKKRDCTIYEAKTKEI